MVIDIEISGFSVAAYTVLSVMALTRTFAGVQAAPVDGGELATDPLGTGVGLGTGLTTPV